MILFLFSFGFALMGFGRIVFICTVPEVFYFTIFPLV
jgi:hypothetical protein